MIPLLKNNMKIIINDDKKTVIARVTIDKIYAIFLTCDDKNKIKDYLFNNDKNDYLTFVGVARLKDGDTSNIENAKKIAICKMERQFYKHVIRHAKEEKRKLESCLNENTKTIDNCTKIIECLDRRIMETAYYK